MAIKPRHQNRLPGAKSIEAALDDRGSAQRSPISIPVGFDPAETMVFGIEDLPSALHELNSEGSKRILILQGDHQRSRSTLARKLSEQSIYSFSQYDDNLTPVYFDLEQMRGTLGASQLITPYCLARRLLAGLDYDVAVLPPLPTEGLWSRWSLDFYDSLEIAAQGEVYHIWIVIDAFGVILPQFTMDFIWGLAARLKVDLRQFRMILSGF